MSTLKFAFKLLLITSSLVDTRIIYSSENQGQKTEDQKHEIENQEPKIKNPTRKIKIWTRRSLITLYKRQPKDFVGLLKIMIPLINYSPHPLETQKDVK